MIDPELKDLIQRVTVIEQNWKIYAWVFATAGALLAIVAGIRLQNLFKWAEKKAQDKVTAAIEKSQLATAEEAAAECINSAKAAKTAIEHERSQTVSAGMAARQQIGEVIADEHTPGLLVQYGENEISLVNENYRRAEITFAKEFPAVPSIFVGEAVAGEWIFVKVDSKSTKGFV
ncbi:MAG TPA: hypothetical protein VMI53_03235 [Opitutaceae bacterium]|nr:hypothetical protein [Opitutaceae bacterium]